MHHMNTEASTQETTSISRGISTDAKFWWSLTPFLIGSTGVWSYLVWHSVSWLVHEAPMVIPRFVSLLTSWA